MFGVRYIWRVFAIGLNGCRGHCDHESGITLDWGSFGYLQAVRDFSPDAEIRATAQYCIDFSLGKINLEGE